MPYKPYNPVVSLETDKLFDTGILSRDAGERKPSPLLVQNPASATMYVCGVTVYDHCHLGHARSAAAFDLISRRVRSKVSRLAFARNVTDIDDKIIARAAERGLDWRDLASAMERSMREDFAALGCLSPDIEPRATEHIPEMIALVGELIARQLAYVDAEGSVWRDGSTWNGIGRVSGRSIDELFTVSRVSPHPGKRGPKDFVLWKAAKPGEPSWQAPWGAGRPGWHIECSAMSRKSLGDTLDLHGGGEDLKFPHHECECAQSEPITGKPLSRRWLHNGFVVLPKPGGQTEEMHKSSGNAMNIKKLLAIHPGEAIRLWALSAHYRQPLPYTEESLDQARTRAWRWAQARELALENRKTEGVVDPAVSKALDLDFNSPAAFSRLDSMGKALRSGDKEHGDNFIASLDALGFGNASALELAPRPASPPSMGAQETRAELDRLSTERDAARASQNWALADRLREQMRSLGLEVKDKPKL
jgi:cysteinyl-tRNA synthetase